jgi:hypothetical protein
MTDTIEANALRDRLSLAGGMTARCVAWKTAEMRFVDPTVRVVS